MLIKFSDVAKLGGVGNPAKSKKMHHKEIWGSCEERGRVRKTSRLLRKNSSKVLGREAAWRITPVMDYDGMMIGASG